MAKGPDAFRTISEAADEVGVPQHVLRFWETRFNFISPMKRAGGRRFYRPSDIVVLKGVRALLHDKGYTIKGVQKLHREEGIARLSEAGGGGKVPMSVAAVSAHESVVAAPVKSVAEAAPVPKVDISLLHGALSTLTAAKASLDRTLTEAGARGGAGSSTDSSQI